MGSIRADERRAPELIRDGRGVLIDARNPGLTVDVMRAAIAEQRCPWCETGPNRDAGAPYRILAMHTTQAHGVTSRDLKELAFLKIAASICSPETRRKRQAQLVKHPLAGSTGGEHRYTAAGRLALREAQWRSQGVPRKQCPVCGDAVGVNRKKYCSWACKAEGQRKPT